MQTLYLILHALNLLLAGLSVLSLVSALVRFHPQPHKRKEEAALSILIGVVFGGTAWLAGRLREQGQLGTGVLMLVACWAVAIGITVYAAGKARWN
jgi:hypothetical protein